MEVAVQRLINIAPTALFAAALTACSDRAVPTQPSLSANGSVASASVGGGSDRGISLNDACEPASFTANGVACSRDGGVSFNQFIADVTRNGSAGAWHMAPGVVNTSVGVRLDVTNKGGEVHTFTKVKQFGGGIVPFLNQISGNPVPAPECLAIAGNAFIPPDAVHHDNVGEGATLYQCCIHPWMRAVVNGTDG